MTAEPGPSTSEPLRHRVALVRAGREGAGFVRLCRELAKEFELPWVALELAGDGPDLGLPMRFEWPADRAGSLPRQGLDLPVLLTGQAVAVLRLPAGSFRRLDDEQIRNLQDVAELLGPVLHLARLEHERELALRRAREFSERIAATRRQAFAERDQERRQLERDLHDGVQHRLVALRMSMAVLEVRLSDGEVDVAALGLAQLRSAIEQTEQILLGTAAGGDPQLLAERGLGPALAGELGELLQEVIGPGDSGRLRRFPPVIESAVYFSCLEAVNNARKHAPGARIEVLLREEPAGLTFSVTDDGPGLDGAESAMSFGLRSIRARVEAVGGTLRLRTAPGQGTTIEGGIPLDRPDLSRSTGRQVRE
jgi:signal transduction histidine kinase